MQTKENADPTDQLMEKSNRYLALMKRLTALAEENSILSRDFQQFPGSVAFDCITQAREKICLFAQTGATRQTQFVKAATEFEDLENSDETESRETESCESPRQPETLNEAVFDIAIKGLLNFIKNRQLKLKARALIGIVRFPGFTSRNKVKLQALIRSRIAQEAKVKSTWTEKKSSDPAVDAFFAAELKHCEEKYLEAEAKIMADEKKLVIKRRFLAACILLSSGTRRCAPTERMHPNYSLLNSINEIAEEITSPVLPPLRQKHGSALAGLPALGSVVRAATRRCMLRALRVLELPQLGPRQILIRT